MPWSRNPLTAKQKAQRRKQLSQADYANKQSLADSDAAELPGKASVQGFNADRGQWKISTQGGSLYAPSLTSGATEGAAYIPGAGLLPRESLAITVATASVIDLSSPTATGFAMLYLVEVQAFGPAERRLVLIWSDTQATQEIAALGDPWLDTLSLGVDANRFRVFALNADEALVIGGGTAPTTAVPPDGARRLSIWRVSAVDGVISRENVQWIPSQDGTAFTWADDELKPYKPLFRQLLTSTTNPTTFYSQIEIDGGIVNGPYSLDFNSNPATPYQLRQGGYNDQGEYLELPNFRADYAPFLTPNLLYQDGVTYEYPQLYNLFSVDTRDILLAVSPTEWEVAGQIAAYAPPQGIQGVPLAESSLGAYYLYGTALTELEDRAQTSVRRFQELMGNNLIIDELSVFVSNSLDPLTGWRLFSNILIPGYSDTTEGFAIVATRGYQYRVVARKPYRTTILEPTS